MYFLSSATGSEVVPHVNSIVISSRQWSENDIYSITLGHCISLTPEAKPCSVIVHFGGISPVPLAMLV